MNKQCIVNEMTIARNIEQLAKTNARSDENNARNLALKLNLNPRLIIFIKTTLFQGNYFKNHKKVAILMDSQQRISQNT